MKAHKVTKCEEWSVSFVCLICSLVLITFSWGGWITYSSGIIPFIGFGVIILINLYAAFYTTCRHCYYYGKRCYAALSLLVPLFFKKVNEPVNVHKEGVWLLIFAVNIFYPIVFLVLDNQLSLSIIIHSVLYLFPSVIVVFLVGNTCCPKCKNIDCAVNPDREK